MPVYLQIAPAKSIGSFGLDVKVDEGKALKGDVTVPGHVHWIDVTLDSLINKPTRRPGDFRVTGMEHDVMFTRDSTDGISPLLMRWFGTGVPPFKGRPVAIIHFLKKVGPDVRGDLPHLELYQEFTLVDVTVSAYQITGNGNSRPSESFTLGYQQMGAIRYRPDPDPASDDASTIM